MTIKSKVFNYGNECEAAWPPKYPKKHNGFFGYWDAESQSFKEGYPPQPEKFGTAPQVIFDSMPPEYHEQAQRVVESRKEWEMLDKQHNTISFGGLEEVKRHTAKGTKDEQKAVKQDRRKANEEALQHYKENPKEVKQMRQKKAEAQIEVLKKSGLAPDLKKVGVKI